MASFFTFNTGSFIIGTQQIGNLAITNNPSAYPGYTWWAGAPDVTRYILARQVSSRPANTLIPGATVNFGFLGSTNKTDASYLALVNSISGQNFTVVQNATNWLNDNGYWSSNGSSSATDVITEGLVLKVDASNPSSYPGTGTTWFDLSGNDYDGTLVNGVTWNTSGSFSFTGSSLQYVNFGDPIETRLTSSNFVTYQGWFKADGSWNNSASVDVNSTPLFSKYNEFLNPSGNIAQGFFNDLSPRSSSHGDPVTNSGLASYIHNSQSGDNGRSLLGYEGNTNTQLYASQWYMVTLSILLGTDVALTASQYINNQNFGTNNVNSPYITTGSMVNDAPLVIGAIPLYEQEVYMYGECGAFYVYNRELSQAEITANFNATKARYGY